MAKNKNPALYNGIQPRLNLKLKILEVYGSQVSLAKETGISEWVISRIVRGWLNPSLYQLNTIAAALKVKNPNDLLQ